MYELSEYFNIVDVYSEEKKEGMGEDYFSYSYPRECQNNNAFIAVFDGCGGIGAKRYKIDAETTETYTGAYLASRVCAYKTLEYYENSGSFDFDISDCKKLKYEYCKALDEINNKCLNRGSELRGSLASKSFPTTASIISVSCQNGHINSEFLWVGDSRGYILDSSGLRQVTEDDLNGEQDAMSNISSDASLSNVINLGVDFDIHFKLVKVNKPSLFISATDGCFGYFPTPMHFEYVILDSICSSENIMEFEEKIRDYINTFTADDFTFGIIATGFGSFKSMKSYFMDREKYIYDHYISVMEDAYTDDIKYELWEKYKTNYYSN